VTKELHISMLIKLGEGHVINVSTIKQVMVTEVPTIKTIKGMWFDKKVEEGSTFSIELYYKNCDGKDAKFTLTEISLYKDAIKIKNEILDQAKEVDANTLTAALENAIRNS